LSSRSGTAVRRRIVAGLLVFLSVVLITIYFREPSNGGLHGVQSAGATVLRPFEVGAERIAQPFRDAYGWFAGLVHAKSENSRLRAEVDKYRQLAIQNEGAAQVNSDLKRQLGYVGSPQFPGDYNDVPTDIIGRSPSEFDQQLTIAAGTSSGIRAGNPVVNADGLIGLVTKVTHDTAQVTLLTDPELKVSAIDLATQASGMVAAGQARGTLVLDRVSKAQKIQQNDLIVTQGWRFGPLSSHYPRGIAIGTVSGASQSDLDLFWNVQVHPSVDFGNIRSVLVLVPKDRKR
jgi:rod shape-determining protein MreC